MADESESGVSFDIVLKVAERCNLACPYCYYYFQEYDGNDNPKVMTDEVLAELPSFFNRSLDELNITRLNFVLHGGEPLMMKKEKLDSLCTNLRTSLEHRVVVNFALQTNGVLIDNEWIEIFSKHNIRVGVSIDGTPEQHDLNRPDHKGKGSYERTVAGLRLLLKAFKDGRLKSAGALAVVHPFENSASLLQHLVDDLGTSSPKLNFPHGGWDSPHAVNWNKEVESHRGLIRYWLENLVAPKFHRISGFQERFFALVSEEGAHFANKRMSFQHFIATVSGGGKLMVDDNMLGAGSFFSENPLYVFGNSLVDLIRSPAWQMMNNAIDRKPLACEGCEWYRVCGGGALFNRYSKSADFSNKSVICDTIKVFNDEISKFLIENKISTAEEISEILSKDISFSAQNASEILFSKKTLTSIVS